MMLIPITSNESARKLFTIRRQFGVLFKFEKGVHPLKHRYIRTCAGKIWLEKKNVKSVEGYIMEDRKKKLKVLTTDNKIIFLDTIHFCKQTKQYRFGIDKSNGYRIMNYNPI